MSDESQTLLPVPADPPQVPTIVVHERPVTDQDALLALQRLGFVELRRNDVNDLATVGTHLHGAGVVRVQQGRIMVSQQQLADTMRTLYDAIIKIGKADKPKTGDLTRLAAVLGTLSSRQNESIKLMVNLEGGQTETLPPESVEGLVPSFGKGAKIMPNQTLIMSRETHVHQADHPATTK